ncbi:hypothetical protein [Novosphingobium sp.]|uniref:hypothetical protein n=1 Tax=Novosphingobium sp. TaxID=1874826 RepID=UPI002619D919|nr:hypothetical protein [Novosphingobium sp.]
MQMGYDFDKDWPAADAAAWRARPGAVRAGDAALVADGAATAIAAAEPAPLRHPDWSSLRARFAAIHALHRTLNREMAVPVAVGGFASAGESVLSACRPGPVVNPVYWANIKAPCAINGPVAVPPHAATED